MTARRKLPQYAESERQGDRGVRMVERRVGDDLGWVFRAQPITDLGIDGYVEVISTDGHGTGRLVAVQIKAGPSFFRRKTEGGWVFRSDYEHLNYWLDYALPVAVVLCDLESDRCWWAEVREDDVRRADKSWTTVVPFDQPLDVSARQALQAIARQARPGRRPLDDLEDEATTDGAVQRRAPARTPTPSMQRVELQVGEVLGSPPYTYTVRTASELQTSGESAQPLGVGSAGVVYSALFKGSMPRAIKLLAPDPQALRGIDPKAFTISFEAEQRLLSGITHTRISKLSDFGTIEAGGRDYLFYAMDLIEGEHLDQALDAGRLSGREFLDVVDQLLDALAYLHSRLYMHCDVKGSNVLVQRQGRGWQATLVDLGTAKVIKDEEGGQIDIPEPHNLELLERLGDMTTFNSSRKLMRPEWLARLTTKIPYSQLREMFPSHDLYSVGLLVDRALDPEGKTGGRLEQELGADIAAGMGTIRDRLLAPAGAEYYRGAEHLRDDWRKLDPGYMAPLDVEELAADGAAMTSIPLPGGRAVLTKRAIRTLNHPLMQRLRHIPQLELVSLINPGATHTRLLHALATFEMAKRFVVSLLGDPLFRLMAEPVDVEAALLWALLHDVGHYPLSHMFEDLAEEERIFGLPRTIPSNDDLFLAYLAPERVNARFQAFPEAIAGALHNSDAQPRTSLPEQLRESGYPQQTLDAVWGIAQRDTPARTVLAAMLSSPIDVSKIAYLADDSRTTGVGYGLGRDLDALLSSLRAPAESDIRLGKPLLAITDKGLPAAEQIVLARYWMLRRVYWHKTNRAIIAMIKFVARELLSVSRLSMAGYVADHLFSNADAGLRTLSRRFDDAARDAELGHDLPVRNPLPGLMGGNRRLYKEVLELAYGPSEADRRLQGRLSQLAPNEQPGMLLRLEETISPLAGMELRRGDVILDVPSKPRQQLGAPVLIYADHGATAGVPLAEASPLLSSHGAEFALHVRKSRVFVHPDIAARLDLNRTRDAVRAVLEEQLETD